LNWVIAGNFEKLIEIALRRPNKYMLQGQILRWVKFYHIGFLKFIKSLL